jgi:integrase/recombinase XerD
MTSLTIKNPKYELMRQGYKEWLETLGYSKSVVYNNPIYLIEFLHYIESQGVNDIENTTNAIIKTYFEHLQNRKKMRTAGTMKNCSINGRLVAVEQFSVFLLKEYSLILPFTVKKLPTDERHKEILSQEEIKLMYSSTESDHLGLRDRACLSLFYGCALRSNEGCNLDVSDILFDRNLLHIRKTKNRHDRLVPMTEKVKNDLLNYLLYGRPHLLKNQSEKSFLVSRQGFRVNNGSLRHRINKLLINSGITRINGLIGLHSLRHSIATHLLQKGMKLDDISQFLGHLSLDSTQIYTHILHEIQ